MEGGVENWEDISLIYFRDIKRFFFKFGTFQFAFCSILDEKFGGKTRIIWADQRFYSLHTFQIPEFFTQSDQILY